MDRVLHQREAAHISDHRGGSYSAYIELGVSCLELSHRIEWVKKGWGGLAPPTTKSTGAGACGYPRVVTTYAGGDFQKSTGT